MDSVVSASGTTFSSRTVGGSRRLAPSPYADPSRLPAVTTVAPQQRPISASPPPRRHRAPNPIVFDRLAAGLASVERQGDRRGGGGGAGGGPSPPRPSTANAPSSVAFPTQRARRSRRPAWARAQVAGDPSQQQQGGGGYSSESEAAHLAGMLNGQAMPTLHEGGGPSPSSPMQQPPPRPRTASPSWTDQGFVSNSLGRDRHSSEISHRYYDK